MLTDAIYIRKRTGDADARYTQANETRDALPEGSREPVEGGNAGAGPDHVDKDIGGGLKDDPFNQDEAGENEILVVSIGTSLYDSRVKDIKGIEDAIQKANPGWSVRRAFAVQAIIDRVQARDGEVIDNIDQALKRAVSDGVKNLVIQPTYLLHGAEYDELVKAVEAYRDEFETVKTAEPLLGEAGTDASGIGDKEAVEKAIVESAVKTAGYESLDGAKEDGTAFIFVGHGTSHHAKTSYSRMQSRMKELGYDNVFIGTVEEEPEETSRGAVLEAVVRAGHRKVVLRPLMVSAGSHAGRAIAGKGKDSWLGIFRAAGRFHAVDVQMAGLGSVEAIRKIYAEHTKEAITQ